MPKFNFCRTSNFAVPCVRALQNIAATEPTECTNRDYKNFVESDFIEEILQVPWDIVCQFDDPCWQVWKSLFLEILDRHAPIRCKRTRGNSDNIQF